MTNPIVKAQKIVASLYIEIVNQGKDKGEHFTRGFVEKLIKDTKDEKLKIDWARHCGYRGNNTGLSPRQWNNLLKGLDMLRDGVAKPETAPKGKGKKPAKPRKGTCTSNDCNRHADPNNGVQLCSKCYDEAGYENEHQDGGHQPGEFPEFCPMCAAVVSDEPATVVEADATEGFAIPEAPAAEGPAGNLDLDKTVDGSSLEATIREICELEGVADSFTAVAAHFGVGETTLRNSIKNKKIAPKLADVLRAYGYSVAGA